MLIGAHVSTAGGLAKAVARGEQLGCDSIQIFNQSPRMWRPTAYGEEDFAAFREAMDRSRVSAVIIHAVYLINCATPDRTLRRKSLASLTHALRIGDAINATGVVLHPGARKDAPLGPAIGRAGKVIGAAVAESEACPVLIEQMAGHAGILGHTFDEIAALTEAAGGGDRVGMCLDSCHLFVSGYDITTIGAIGDVLDEADAKVGLDRLRALHINDSKVPFGANLDRHENLGKGEIGGRSLGLFLSEPRFEGLVATLETPGPAKQGPVRGDIAYARRLRSLGVKARDRSRAGSSG
ncbi:MAG: deoxyribonuclease IV [Solirubrobacterales bacterium]|nr:deoxyribonuclease IV [Solirubrobacterales bacterium]